MEWRLLFEVLGGVILGVLAIENALLRRLIRDYEEALHRLASGKEKAGLDATALIEDGIQAVDFILNYGRGMKSRVLRLWLQRAKEFAANGKDQAR